jgi:hypothetical protein
MSYKEQVARTAVARVESVEDSRASLKAFVVDGSEARRVVLLLATNMWWACGVDKRNIDLIGVQIESHADRFLSCLTKTESPPLFRVMGVLRAAEERVKQKEGAGPDLG